MLDNANFLTDKETVKYFNILKEDHKNVMKFAQEAMGLVTEANTCSSSGGEVCTSCWLGLSAVFSNPCTGFCNQWHS